MALGLTAVHGGMLELLNTFVVLSAALLPVDIYVFIFGGLSTWLILALICVVITRCGCIWFGCAADANPHLYALWSIRRSAVQPCTRPMQCTRLGAQ